MPQSLLLEVDSFRIRLVGGNRPERSEASLAPKRGEEGMVINCNLKNEEEFDWNTKRKNIALPQRAKKSEAEESARPSRQKERDAVVR